MSGGGLRTFGVNDLIAVYGGIRITGWADGEFMTIVYDNDVFTETNGADGEVARVKSNKLMATATIRLLQTSPTNDGFSAEHILDFLEKGTMQLWMAVGENNKVICVGAVDENLVTAVFSSRGEEMDIGAPGVGIASCYKDNRYAKMSGTSMATPYVAGCAALYVSYCKKVERIYSHDDFMELLTKTSKDIDDIGLDQKSGYGLIQPVKLLASLYNPPPDPIPPNPDTPPEDDKENDDINDD